MTDRIPLDAMTSDALDQLYAELDRLRARVQDWRTSTGAGIRLVDELRAERDALAAGVPLICSDERHKTKVFALETARSTAEQRAERAEALAAERWKRIVKQSNLLQELKRGSFHLRMDIIALLEGRMGEIGPSDIRPGDISRAALDEQQEQT